MRLLIIILFFSGNVSFAQNWQQDAAPLHRAQKTITSIMVHDIFSPPVASRIYAYTNIAAYEVFAKQHTNYHSLQTQIKNFPSIPAPTSKISSSLAGVYAFLLTGKNLLFSEAVMQDSMTDILKWYADKNISDQEYKASLQYGQTIANIIINWAANDQYKQTRSSRRYQFSKDEGKWMPTPPVYMAAVEPNWNKIRPLVLDSCTQFQPELALPFSTDKSSGFYTEAAAVYKAVNELTQQQKAIASFWDCNPFAVTTEGHLNFASKKISPGGHWMSIAGVASNKAGANIAQSAATYTLTAITLFDAFISCWDEKYRSNVIRPETYINRYMDESWRPLLQTPPFPEYTSGHSVISTAAAAVLTHLFGNNFEYLDDTEVDYGLPVKQFSSFTQACNEAAISRFYGGIHYMAAIENGQTQGRNLGNWVLNKIQLQ